MPVSRLAYLFDRYVNYTCTATEEAELMALLALPENETAVQMLMEELIEITGPERRMPDRAATSVLHNILQKENPVTLQKGATIVHPLQKTSFFIRMCAAAVAIFLMAGVTYWSWHKRAEVSPRVAAAAKKEIEVLPGRDRALLTTSNGSTIALDSLNGNTLLQGDAKIINQAGLLTYHTSGLSNSGPGPGSNIGSPVAYNTVATPRGGQYRIVLADGTKVWLNAASSLYFPTAFTGDQREVQLTGEAYFEVAPDKAKPFRVKAGDMQIRVLGTHFNVNAYPDERTVKTSLLEGSVKITDNGATGLLKPGQQATLDREKSSLKITDANMDEVIAWKNGLFQFEGADITSIMKQIGRWYDVEIVFSGKIPVKRFEGKISRNSDLSDVLQIFELSQIKFSIEGKKIIVQ